MDDPTGKPLGELTRLRPGPSLDRPRTGWIHRVPGGWYTIGGLLAAAVVGILAARR